MYINKKLNDDDLIDAILNGDDKSLEALLLKYDPYISYYIFKRCGYFDEDYIQEGRLVLYHAIYDYKKYKEYSFFSFFKLCLERKTSKLIYNDINYQNTIKEIGKDLYLHEDPSSSKKRDKLFFPKLTFESDIEYIIYEEVIIEGKSLTDVSKKLNMSYQKAYYYYKRVLKKILNEVGKYVYSF